MSGPRNTGSLGDEPTLNRWFIARSDGGDHLENTQIYSSGSTHQVTGSLIVTAGITGSLSGSASFATNATSSSYALSASYAPGITVDNNVNNYILTATGCLLYTSPSPRDRG